MPRARNIKPSFFTNEVLCQLPPLTRLLFIGLWTEADREGRLEDRPVRIKMRVFPLDTFDIEAALDSLHKKGFITRYSVAGDRYIEIPKWKLHQRPHIKEALSLIPAPSPEKVGASTYLGSGEHLPKSGEPEKGCVEPGKSRCEHALIPDTGYLIPDSGEREPEPSALARLPRPPHQALPLDQDPQADLAALAEELVQQLPAAGDAHLTRKALERDFGHSATFAGDSARYVASVRERARIWCEAWNANASLRVKPAQYWIQDGDYARKPPPPRTSSNGMTRLVDLFPEDPYAR